MTLTIWGHPYAKGSKRGFIVRGAIPALDRVSIAEGSDANAGQRKRWSAALATAALLYRAKTRGFKPLDGPLDFCATFYLPRPKSTPQRILRPAVKPDLDKLCRAIGDGLSLLYVNDSRIVKWEADEFYADQFPPCVVVRIEASNPLALPLLLPDGALPN
ncbi:MAG: hypothetical protein NVSMB5_22540 [Candidatus Velthaea sp.]